MQELVHAMVVSQETEWALGASGPEAFEALEAVEDLDGESSTSLGVVLGTGKRLPGTGRSVFSSSRGKENGSSSWCRVACPVPCGRKLSGLSVLCESETCLVLLPVVAPPLATVD